MQKTRWNPKIGLGLGVQSYRVPLAECWRIGAHIDRNIEDLAAHNRDEFSHAGLRVEAANDAEFRE